MDGVHDTINYRQYTETKGDFLIIGLLNSFLVTSRKKVQNGRSAPGKQEQKVLGVPLLVLLN
jgi:hypothetical protein